MKLVSFLSPNDILINIKANSKKQVFEEMLHHAAMRMDAVNPRAILDLLIERERLGCTGIGNGIAIPHTRCALPPEQSKPIALLAILDQPIDFDASDGQPVDIVFMLLAPVNCGGEHLTVLALASRLLSTGDTAQALRRAKSVEAARAAIAEAVDPSRTAA